MKILVYIPFLAAILFTAPLHAQRPEPLVSPEIRLEAAQSYLQNQTTQIGVYAKGLVCSSCGIGLRVHLSKLDSIDKKQFKKGVFLDASKQLLILALKPGAQADIGGIRQAIVDAGYDPSQYFLWKNGEVEVHSFSKES